MLSEQSVGHLYLEHENDAVRLAGVAKYLPEIGADDVDADTIAWLDVVNPSGSHSVVVGKTPGNNRSLCIVHAVGPCETAYIHGIATLLSDAEIDPHFEPESLRDVLLRLGIKSLAVRLKPRNPQEIALVHEAEMQSDVIIGFKCTAYYTSNGEPADRLADRFDRLIDHAKAEGMLTGNSDAELVRFEVKTHNIKSQCS